MTPLPSPLPLLFLACRIAFVNEKGENPDGCVSWQFNFKFNLREDMYAQDSIDLLMEVRHHCIPE